MKKRSGFTLIECCVVVAIIAILLAIIVPVFMSAGKKRQTMGAMSKHYPACTSCGCSNR